jgi:hypothetical protein
MMPWVYLATGIVIVVIGGVFVFWAIDDKINERGL